LLLVEEAGGRVSPYPSHPGGLLSGAPVVAAAPGIYNALRHLVQEG